MPERVLLRCPHCESKLQVRYRLVGSTCTCPKCQGQVKVRIPVPSDADIALVGFNEPAPALDQPLM